MSESYIWPKNSDAYELKAKLYDVRNKVLFRAVCTENGSKCVIKQITFSDVGHIKELQSEVEASKLEPHSNVMHYYTCFIRNWLFRSPDEIERRVAWIVMEEMDCSIEHIIEGIKGDKETIRVILKEILEGICYLHSKSVIHRDIKPQNVLCRFKDGSIKIADFGTLGIISDCEERLTKCGTLIYMAPEVVRERDIIAQTSAVDIWSFGILCCHLAVGTVKPHATDVRYKRIDHLIDAICSYMKPEMPTMFGSDFEELINKCLQNKPNDRASARDLLNLPFFAPAKNIDAPKYLMEVFKKFA